MALMSITINCPFCGVPLQPSEGVMGPVDGEPEEDRCIWLCPDCGRDYIWRREEDASKAQ